MGQKTLHDQILPMRTEGENGEIFYTQKFQLYIATKYSSIGGPDYNYA